MARAAGAPINDGQRILGSVLACGGGTVASHSAAARVWGLQLPRWRLEVISAQRDSRRAPAGVLVHRPSDRVDLWPARRGGIPVTNPLRLLVDLGAVVPLGSLEAALDQFVVAGTVDVAAVRTTLDRHAGRGRAVAHHPRSMVPR